MIYPFGFKACVESFSVQRVIFFYFFYYYICILKIHPLKADAVQHEQVDQTARFACLIFNLKKKTDDERPYLSFDRQSYTEHVTKFYPTAFNFSRKLAFSKFKIFLRILNEFPQTNM